MFYEIAENQRDYCYKDFYMKQNSAPRYTTSGRGTSKPHFSTIAD